MNILDNVLYNSDIKRVVDKLDFSNFPQKKTFLVTGASGLICSSVVDLLVAINIKQKAKCNILLAGRNEEKLRKRFFDFFEKKLVSFIYYDASKFLEFPSGIDYIVHGAAIAYPKLIGEKPVETLMDSLIGLNNLLNYARKESSRVLLISSSEVYGQIESCNPLKENQQGIVKFLRPRSSYSIGKQASENLCLDFLNEYGVKSVIVRPGHIYGPTAGRYDNRVSSEFMYKAAMGENLILKSEGKQIRSYCYCLDCASAIITVLITGVSGEAYNISNKNSLCSIKEMAELFSKYGKVKLEFQIPSKTELSAFNPMLNSSLDSTKLEALGWKALFTKEEGFEHSVLICKEIID